MSARSGPAGSGSWGQARELVAGDPEALRRLAQRLDQVAAICQDEGNRLRTAHPRSWAGAAAQEFEVARETVGGDWVRQARCAERVAMLVRRRANDLIECQRLAQDAVLLRARALGEDAGGRPGGDDVPGWRDAAAQLRQAESQYARALALNSRSIEQISRQIDDQTRLLPTARRLDDPGEVDAVTVTVQVPEPGPMVDPPPPVAPTAGGVADDPVGSSTEPGGGLAAAARPERGVPEAGSGFITAALSGGDPPPPPRPPSADSGDSPTRRVVRAGDTLWDISAQELGRGSRWPEVFAASTEVVQPDGRRLSDPDLIRPGWEVVTGSAPTGSDPETDAGDPAEGCGGSVPAPDPPAGPRPERPPSWDAAPPGPGDPSPGSDLAPRGEPGDPGRPAPVEPGWPGGEATGRSGGVDRVPVPDGPGGLDVGEGVFVGLGLAAAVVLGGLVVSARDSRGYRPGSGERGYTETGPVVGELRAAYRRRTGGGGQDLASFRRAPQHLGPRPDDGPGPRPGQGRPPSTTRKPRAREASRGGVWVPLGELGEGVAVVDLAAVGGLGLHGPGGADAARAVVVAVLAGEPGQTPPGTVIIPEADAAALFGVGLDPAALPRRLRIVPDLAAALTELDRCQRRRRGPRGAGRDPVTSRGTGRGQDNADGMLGAGPVVVVTTTPTDAQLADQLSALITDGRPVGVSALVLGDWTHGSSCRIGTDARVHHVRGRAVEPLLGARVFTLPARHARDLLTLLRGSQPTPPTTHTTPGPRPSVTARSSGDSRDAGGCDTALSTPAGNDPTPPGPEEPPPVVRVAATRPVADPDPAATAAVAADPPDTGTASENSRRPAAETQAHTDRASITDTWVALRDEPASKPDPTTSPAGRPRSPGEHRDPAHHDAEGHADAETGAGLDPRAAVRQQSESVSKSTTPMTPVASGSSVEAVGEGPPLALDVLGGPRLVLLAGAMMHDVMGELSPRLQELLVCIAVHPDGIRRDALVEALWTDRAPHRPTNVLNTTVARLRTTVTHAITPHQPHPPTDTAGQPTERVAGWGEVVQLLPDGRYRLNPRLVEVDYLRHQAARAAWRGALTDPDRTTACQALLDNYRGELGVGIDGGWIEPLRVECRRDAVDAAEALAAHHDQRGELELALAVLERAVECDPYNEALYRQVMTHQHHLGRPDAARRTLRLLTSRLADIAELPEPDTMRLASPSPSPPTPEATASAVRQSGAPARANTRR